MESYNGKYKFWNVEQGRPEHNHSTQGKAN